MSTLLLCRCYAGKGHPELSRLSSVDPTGSAELVFSYVCNSASDSNLLFEPEHLSGLYAPTFVRITVAQLGEVVTDKKA